MENLSFGTGTRSGFVARFLRGSAVSRELGAVTLIKKK